MIRLSLCLLALCWGSFASAAPRAHTNHFSDDGHVLLHIDLQRLQKGQTPKHLLGLMMSNPQTRQNINAFKQHFGVDPFKDVDSLTVEVKILESGKEPQILMHVVGRFDQPQLLKGLTQQGNTFTQETINGHLVHISAGNNSALTFLKDGVILGTTDRLKANLKGVTFGGELKNQQGKLLEGGDIWFAAHLPERIRAEIKASNSMAADSSAMRGFLDFAQGLNMSMTTEFVSPAVSKSVETRLKLMLEQAKLSPQAAMFMNMVNKVKITTQGPELTVSVPLSQDDMNQIQAIVSMMLMSLSMQQPKPATLDKRSAPRFPQLNAPVAPGSQPAQGASPKPAGQRATPVPTPAPASAPAPAP